MKDFEGSRLKEREAQDFQREKRQLLRRIGEVMEKCFIYKTDNNLK